MSSKKQPEFIFGSHTVDNGGIDMAVRRAANAGLSTLQCFTAIPKFYGDKSTIRPERVQRFQAALEETGIRPEHVVVHAAYVLSVATADPTKWARAAGGLKKEMERSNTLGVGGVCFHPGSASDGDPVAAAERVARAMVEAIEAHDGPTRLLVENTAGAGKTLGRTAAEVADILSHIPKVLRPRAGYGLDTCHLFASGYDIHTSRERFTEILDEFEDAIGEPPSFFHLNDSEGELGSNRDRHMLLGDGRIGVDAFGWLLQDPRSRGIPLILETPQQNYDVAPEDASGDPYDLRMAGLLVELSA
ncbi:MAG TPA: deoxyribonuclease IV [Longimicrobiales bacterium]|nr:deoxyribonuclease IV [Longimicrobiales bacterium]